jgi:hypothetical protein
VSPSRGFCRSSPAQTFDDPLPLDYPDLDGAFWVGQDVRIAGYALGDSLHGLFRQHGRWLFLSFEEPNQVIRILL